MEDFICKNIQNFIIRFYCTKLFEENSANKDLQSIVNGMSAKSETSRLNAYIKFLHH